MNKWLRRAAFTGGLGIALVDAGANLGCATPTVSFSPVQALPRTGQVTSIVLLNRDPKGKFDARSAEIRRGMRVEVEWDGDPARPIVTTHRRVVRPEAAPSAGAQAERVFLGVDPARRTMLLASASPGAGPGAEDEVELAALRRVTLLGGDRTAEVAGYGAIIGGVAGAVVGVAGAFAGKGSSPSFSGLPTDYIPLIPIILVGGTIGAGIGAGLGAVPGASAGPVRTDYPIGPNAWEIVWSPSSTVPPPPEPVPVTASDDAAASPPGATLDAAAPVPSTSSASPSPPVTLSDGGPDGDPEFLH